MNPTSHFPEKSSCCSRFLRSRILLIILFGLFLALRLINLTADPPKNLDFSLGLFFDEGIYNHNARNLLLFGEWKLDEWNDYYYSAISTWLKYLTFYIIGIGRAQIRLFSIAFSMISLLFAYLAMRDSFGKKIGIIAALLLGTNYIYLMFNRIGMQDTQPIAVFLAAFYVWQSGMNRMEIGKYRWRLFLAGALFFISYTFKNLFLYLLPVPFVALTCYFAAQYSRKPSWRQLVTAFGVFSAGMFSAFAIWYLTFYLPHKEIIAQFGNFFTKQQMFPDVRLRALLSNFWQTPFFSYFSANPVVLLASCLWLWAIYFLLWSNRRSQIHPADIFLAVWFWAVFSFSGIIAYRPTRYFLPIIPPLCLLAARFIGLLSEAARLKFPEKLHWSFLPVSVAWLAMINHQIVIPLSNHALSKLGLPKFTNTASVMVSSLAALCLTMAVMRLTKTRQSRPVKCPQSLCATLMFLLIGGSLYSDGKNYYRWATSPAYVVAAVGKDLTTFSGDAAYIGGMDAPGVAFDTPYKTLIFWDQYVNYRENPITTYRLTHLFLGDSPAFREREYYFRTYPQEMQSAALLQQYPIKDAMFSLFSLVETRLKNIALAKTTYAPLERIAGTVRLKNFDFRQAKKIALNWLLYPMNVTENAGLVGSGQEIQAWLLPEEAYTFALAGGLPEQAGQYRLLISWNPMKELHCGAETMRYQIGQIARDETAVGKRVMRHNPTDVPGSGFLAYGNYRDYQPGMYETVFRLKIQDHTTTDRVARIDVVANYGKVVLQQRELRGIDFADVGQYQSFIMPYLLENYTPQVEFRVFSYGKTELWADEIQTIYREGVWYGEPLTIKE